MKKDFKPTVEYKHLEKELENLESTLGATQVKDLPRMSVETFKQYFGVKHSLVEKLNTLYDAQTS